MEVIKEKYINLSYISLFSISAFITFIIQFRYFKKNYLYSEYNGHFNSPQNMFNKIQTIHHLKDAGMRGLLVFTFSYFMLSIYQIYLKGFDKISEENYIEEEKILRKKLEEERKRHKSIVIEGEIDKSITKKYDIGNEVKIREKVDKYLEN